MSCGSNQNRRGRFYKRFEPLQYGHPSEEEQPAHFPASQPQLPAPPARRHARIAITRAATTSSRTMRVGRFITHYMKIPATR